MDIAFKTMSAQDTKEEDLVEYDFDDCDVDDTGAVKPKFLETFELLYSDINSDTATDEEFLQKCKSINMWGICGTLEDYENRYEETLQDAINNSRFSDETKKDAINHITQLLKWADYYDVYNATLQPRDFSVEEIAEILNSDINAQTILGFPTTGEDFAEHCKLINKGNVIWVLDSYKETYGQTLEEAINNEGGLCAKTKKEIIAHITKALEQARYYNPYIDKDSKVENEYYKGASYRVLQDGNEMQITNKDTGETVKIDLEKISKGLPFDYKIQLKSSLQDLPGEVLFDIAKEANFDKMDKPDNTGVLAYYMNATDKIYLPYDWSNIDYSIIHEMGHALDFMGYIFNKSSVSKNSKFMKAYNEELQAFVDAGNERYERDKNGHTISGTISVYATRNELEMFAECYELLMTGDSRSMDTILKYFPKTLEAAKEHLAYIRSQSDFKRH